MASIKAKRKILFYGDSNTYGYDPADPYKNRYPLESCWISILSGRLSGKWEILCDAMNGRRIPDLRYDRERLDRLVSRLDPGGLFAIMLGTNDILHSTEPDAGAAVLKMEVLLSFLCSRKSSEDILVVAPPYIADENVADPLYRRFHEESRKMNEDFELLTERFGTGYLNTGIWNIPLCYDMVHFSEEGHRMFAEKLGKYLQEHF